MREAADGHGDAIDADVAGRIRLVIFDVDGVLTDGGVYLGATRSGEAVELKRFDIRDGLGLKLLQWSGLEVALVSGRVSRATELRAAELGVPCHQDDGARKVPAVRAIMDRLEIGWDEVAMLADDLPDLSVFRRVGLKAAVADALPPVVQLATWRSRRPGGHGAAREFCDALLDARGDLSRVTGKYVDDRSEA
jgi:3-deoxy-D-manno-octulosonate 8-phosphate phosphatase (KDO 8-P phosphatase)